MQVKQKYSRGSNLVNPYFKFECSEVLTMGYARRVKEVGEWRGTARIKSRESVPLEG
jgi:hypothetical protein